MAASTKAMAAIDVAVCLAYDYEMIDQHCFLKDLGIQYPIICGAMYPCSNPELIAAASEAGGIGIVQPISLTYVHGYDFRQGLQYIKSLTQKPIGMNVLIEKTSKKYHQRMQQWIDIALEEGIRFFVTSLGKPDWVVEKVHASGGLVYHDVTERKWADIGISCGVDGLICVNNRAGGHAGQLSAEQLYQDLKHLEVPLICAGGLSNATDLQKALKMGYAGAQLGTRFIASKECSANDAYKTAIINAQEDDIVLTERLTGVPVSIINTNQLNAAELKPSGMASFLLGYHVSKKWMRTLYSLKSLWGLKHSVLKDKVRAEYWQAGKSVEGIDGVMSCEEIVNSLVDMN